MGVLTRCAALAAALAAAPACADPCDEDPLGCESGSEFKLDPSCELTGPLEVSLGEGHPDFTPFAALQEPTVHEGSQGGRHLCLALRVDNPALDYPLLQAEFVAEFFDPDRCDGQTDCDPWVRTGDRQLVLGPELPLDESGRMLETDLIVIISLWPEEYERRIRLGVLDPCGRRGEVEHVVGPQS